MILIMSWFLLHVLCEMFHQQYVALYPISEVDTKTIDGHRRNLNSEDLDHEMVPATFLCEVFISNM